MNSSGITKEWPFGNVRELLAANPTSKVVATLLVPGVAVFLWFLISYQLSPLKKYPGPFLAGWTNAWRFYHVLTGRYAPSMKALHEKYGPIVRTGPTLLDLDIPELAKVVYGTDGSWTKSEFYQNNSAVVDGKIVYHLFSEIDRTQHARLKRPIVRHYSVPSVLATEPLMDSVINDFCTHLEKRFIDQSKPCEFGSWLGYYAWDFISAVTFSKRFGYMTHGRDFDGTLHVADQSIDYLGLIGQMPWLDYWLDKNPIVRIGPPNLGTVTRIAAESLFPRLEGKDPNFDPKQPDFLQYFIDSKASHPEVVDEATIMGYLLLNLIAGADTTAITMKALFYHSLRNPRVWARLNAEILAADIGTSRPASHATARAIPYLEAVARETMRMHPAVSMAMERRVPESGLVLPDGSVVPQGMAVGMNPYIVGRNRGIYGDDADEFRPERWLKAQDETDGGYELRMRTWNAADLTFGGGSRICMGRNLSQMELYKVVATVLSRFEIRLVDPNEQWRTSSRWFYRIDGGLTCELKRRGVKG